MRLYTENNIFHVYLYFLFQTCMRGGQNAVYHQDKNCILTHKANILSYLKGLTVTEKPVLLRTGRESTTSRTVHPPSLD